jgi:glycosyltransferase involved in cell wall biosynthesis
MNFRAQPAPARILYVEGNVDGTVGGSYFSLLYLTSGLDRSQFEPIVVFRTSNALIPRYRAAGADVRVIPPGQPTRLRTPPGRLASKVVNFVKGFVIEPRRLANLLRRERIALVHLNNSIIKNHEWMVAARLAGVPCITHERGINPKYPRRARALARGLGAVICISRAVRENLVQQNVDGVSLVTIPNGLDPSESRSSISPDTIRREFGIDQGRALVGMVGNFKEWKGQDVVVRAIQLLRERHPRVACMLIGDSSPEAADYERRIRQLILAGKLSDTIFITGYRTNVADYVNALDVLIHASVLPEPFGRVLLEGMAMGKPVVASRGGAVPEIVMDGVTGLLFQPGDAGELASCLHRLLSDGELAMRMGSAGHRRLIEEFSIASNIAATQALYSRILARI